jgi:hypothetical protein
MSDVHCGSSMQTPRRLSSVVHGSPARARRERKNFSVKDLSVGAANEPRSSILPQAPASVNGMNQLFDRLDLHRQLARANREDQVQVFLGKRENSNSLPCARADIASEPIDRIVNNAYLMVKLAAIPGIGG